MITLPELFYNKSFLTVMVIGGSLVKALSWLLHRTKYAVACIVMVAIIVLQTLFTLVDVASSPAAYSAPFTPAGVSFTKTTSTHRTLEPGSQSGTPKTISGVVHYTLGEASGETILPVSR